MRATDEDGGDGRVGEKHQSRFPRATSVAEGERERDPGFHRARGSLERASPPRLTRSLARSHSGLDLREPPLAGSKSSRHRRLTSPQGERVREAVSATYTRRKHPKVCCARSFSSSLPFD